MPTTKLTPLALLAALALTACPAGDDDEDTTNASLTTTITGNTDPSDTGTEDSSADASATTPMTTAPADTGAESGDSGDEAPAESSSGGSDCTAEDECREDADCAGGGSCLGCICVGGEESGGATMSDYGACNACAPGESPVQIPPAEGCVCSPACDGRGSECPAPTEGTGQPMCLLALEGGTTPTNCALICELGGDDCPTGATCEDIGQAPAGVCMHPAP